MPVVVHHGDDDAGVIYVKLLHGLREAWLYGPAPPSFDEPDKQWSFVSQLGDRAQVEADVDAFIERQLAFDRDLWVVEVAYRPGFDLLSEWIAA